MYCCVDGCGVVSKHGVTLFQMPIGPTLRRKWLSVIKPSQRLGLDSAVCSKHFASTDLVYVRGKMRLKPKVVPSLLNENQEPSNTAEAQSEVNSNNDDHKSVKTDRESDSDNEPIINAKNRKRKNSDMKRKRRSVRTKSRKGRSNRDDTSSDDDELKSDTNAIKDGSDGKCKNDNSNDSISVKNGEETVKNGGKLDSPLENNESVADDSVEAKNLSAECNILVTPSIEFYYNQDEPTVENEGETVPSKHDIEDILTNYQIKQNNIHSGIDPEDVLQTNVVRNNKIEEIRQRYLQNQLADERLKYLNADNVSTSPEITADRTKSVTKGLDWTKTVKSNNQKSDGKPANQDREMNSKEKSIDKVDVCSKGKQEDRSTPVFVSVDTTQQISSSSGDDEDPPTTRDCVMMLEKVQVDIDPSTLMQYNCSDDDSQDTKKANDVAKSGPISLLTSSDESDVILQEPHIDTVEVSDETDEDEVPLVKLLPKTDGKKEKKEKKTPGKKKKKTECIGWRNAYDYFCYECNYTAKTRKEYTEHRSTHTKVLQICDLCEYTTASRFQYLRHRRKHKEEKRFKCHLCSFKAKHHMSLVYHLKRHNIHEAVIEKLHCDNCEVYQTNNSKWLKRHKKYCVSEKKFKCDNCSYVCKRKTDLRRHITKKHSADEGDKEFVPPNR